MREAFILLIALIVLTACTEVIDFEVDRDGGELVIFGRITDGNLGNEVTVSRTSAFDQEPELIDGATVFVTDDEGNSQQYFRVEKGVYRPDPSSPSGSPGRSYHVEVTFPDGSSFSSIPERMSDANASDSLYFDIVFVDRISDSGVEFTEEIIRVFGESKFAEMNEDFYFKWNIEEVYSFEETSLPLHNFPFWVQDICYITETTNPSDIFIYSSRGNTATSVSHKFVERDIDATFAGKHYFNVTRSSISKATYEYWDKIDGVTNQQGGLFDVPPAAVDGNIRNDQTGAAILGYFEVVKVDTVRTFVSNRELLEYFENPCPIPAGVHELPFMRVDLLPPFFEPRCIDCLSLPRSSLERPPYF